MATTEEVWAQLSDRLRHFFRQRVGSDDVADDLLQETFIRIHKGLDGLADADRLPAWVFRIARNLLTDHYRSQGRQPALGTVDTVADELPAAADDPENMNELVTGWLPAVIRDLPDTYREALEAYELRGLPQQAIADRLGISLSGAKSRVQRGRTMLKEALARCCTFEQDRRGNVINVTSRAEVSDCGDDCCD